MRPTLSRKDYEIIAALQYTGAGLSFVFCLIGIMRLWKRILSESAIRHSSRYLDKLVLILLILDFFDSIVMLNAPNSLRIPTFCQPVAIMHIVLQTMTVEWILLIAFYSLLSLRRQVDKMERYFRTTILIALSISLGTAIWLAHKGYLGPALTMCWIKQKHKIYQFYVFYIPLIIAWIFMIGVSFSVYRAVSKAPPRRPGQLQDPILRLRTQAIILATCCGIVWLIPLISRLLIIFPGVQVPSGLIMVHALCVTLLGFVDSLVYNQTRSIFMACFRKPKDTLRLSSYIERSIPRSTGGMRGTSPKNTETCRGSGRLRIFCTTFNTGSASTELLDELDRWIPKGGIYDVYAIGVQECLIPDQLVDGIHFFLGPSDYTKFMENIGSGSTSLGFHGFIQLMVFVKTPLVRAKSFVRIKSTPRQVPKGHDLLVTKAPNKGAVAISLLICDTTICFICCHLSADLHEKSRLGRRIRQARDILNEVGNLETGFDAQLVHDHCIILGDLNFRVRRMDIPQVLNLISEGARFEESRGGGSSWMEGRYEAILEGQMPSSVHQSSLCADWREMKSHGIRSSNCQASKIEDAQLEASSFSPNPYFSSLIQCDELNQYRISGNIFYGFQERDIRFPPTYRFNKRPHTSTAAVKQIPSKRENITEPETSAMRLWSRHKLDFVDVDELEKTYTIRLWNSKSGTLTTRIPSYTDRILYFSHSDKVDMLVTEAYEACPVFTLSDHIPVSLSLALQVTLLPPSQVAPLPQSLHTAEAMDLKVSFTIADIDCYIAKARSYDLPADLSGDTSECSEPSKRKSSASLNSEERHSLPSEEGEEIPTNPPSMPPGYSKGGSTPWAGMSFIRARITSFIKQSGSHSVRTIESIDTILVTNNEPALSLIERHKISRLASALNIRHHDDEKNVMEFSKVSWRYAQLHGISISSILKNEGLPHNIYVLIRLSDPSGRDLGQGMLVITPDGQIINCLSRSVFLDEETEKREESLSGSEAEDLSVCSKAWIALTSGGLLTGAFGCRLENFKFSKRRVRSNSNLKAMMERRRSAGLSSQKDDEKEQELTGIIVE